MTSSDVVDRRIDPPYLEASAAMVEYVRVQAAHVVARLGAWNGDARGRSTDELRSGVGIVRSASEAFSWLLAEAEAGGYASRAPDGRSWLAGHAPADGDLARAERRVAQHASIVGCSRNMIDYVAGHYPSVLRGERSALSVLFKGEGPGLWDRYFSVANPLYDVHNQLAAEGIRAVWLAIGERRHRVLELGTGTGGATAAILSVMDRLPGGPEADFVISDISPSFLVRVGERFRSSCPSLRSMRIDFGRPLEEQGIAPESLDVIVATNALHAAPDLRGTLTSLAVSLRRGGALVVSESLCAANASVHQEFVFNLLGGLEGSGRRSRFLTSRRWRDALDESGWANRVFVNRTGPELALLALASNCPATFATIARAGA